MDNVENASNNNGNIYDKIIIFLSAILTVYILYTKFTFPPEAFYDRIFYMAMTVLIICCTQLKAYTGIRKLFVVLGTLLSFSACIYMAINVPKIMSNMYRADWNDAYVYIVYFIGIFILLQSNQGGKIISGMGVIIMLYLIFGHQLEGVLHIPPLNIKHIATMAFTDTDQGAFGSFLAITSRTLSVFLLFSCFLVVAGLGDLIKAVSMLGSGKSTGGPAKVAVLASALFGMVSGSPVANVAATGSFTIPLMKSIGYKPKTAAAVETVASSGGNITPPIMGISAFIMCEILGVPYTRVIVWAIIPAFLWYFTTYCFVHFSALSQGVKTWVPEREELMQIIRTRWHLLIALFVLVYYLIAYKVAETAALYSVVALFVVSFFRKETRLNLTKIKEFLLDFAHTITGITILNTMLGIFTAAFLSTGTHTKLIHLVFGGVTHWMALALIVFVLCIVFGMLVPPFAAYIAVVVMAVPILHSAGFELPVIHMFVLYGCVLAPITPPVAIAAFTAAGIAGSDPLKTAMEATYQALPLWVFPFLLLRDRLFLGMGTKASMLLSQIPMIMFGVFLMTIAINRYWVEPISKNVALLLGLMVFLIFQPVYSYVSFVACLIGAAILIKLYFDKRNKGAATAEPAV